MTKTKYKKTKICAIVNVTPDSFSDGDLWYEADQAISHGLYLIEQGADILDIGGESTRPGSQTITSAKEIERIHTVIEGLKAKTTTPISIDTWKSKVAEHAINLGVNMINDISGFLADPEMAELVAHHNKVKFVLMFNAAIARPLHKSSKKFPEFRLKNCPKPFSQNDYFKMSDMAILDLMQIYFEKSLNIALKAGVKKEQIYLDPGIGFALSQKENLILINNLKIIHDLGFPIFLGVSRKRFIIDILQSNKINTEPSTNEGFSNRDHASAALTAIAASQGVAIVRTHTVKEHLIAARIGEAIYQADLAENKYLAEYD